MRFDKTSIYDASFLGVILIEGGLFCYLLWGSWAIFGAFAGYLRIFCIKSGKKVAQ